MKMPNRYGTVTKLSGNRRRPYAVRVPVRNQKDRVRQKHLDYLRTSQEAMEALMDYRKKRGGTKMPQISSSRFIRKPSRT